MGAIEDQARVVKVGAGIVGCSVAYHLAHLGWREIVVLELGPWDPCLRRVALPLMRWAWCYR